MHSWKVSDALSFGWRLAKQHIWFLLPLELFLFLVSFAGGDSFVGMLVSILISFVFLGAILKIGRSQPVSFKTLFHDFSWMRLGHFILARLVAGLIIIIGLVLLVVPGIIAAIATAFASLIVLDQKESVEGNAFWRAIKKSAALTRGSRGKLFVFFLAVLGINILGVIAFGVGLLVTVPVSSLALVYVYDKLRSVNPVEATVEDGRKTDEAPASSVS